MDIRRVLEVKFASKLTKEDLEKEELKIAHEEYKFISGGYRYDDIAIVLYRGKVIATLNELMEPEDVCFGRDLAPFLAAIERAFSIGVAHGQWEAGYGCDPRREPDLLKELEDEKTTTD
jgi:hypothetical protein